MVVELYERLDRQRMMNRLGLQSAVMLVWLPMVVVLSIVAFILGSGSARADGFRFAETTGRAVIMDPSSQQDARLLALEEALYMAALEGGAKVNGFTAITASTAVEDHFVVRPASRILDYVVTNEVMDDTHYMVSIRAAIGELPRSSCAIRRNVNMTVFKPEIIQQPDTPATTGPMAVKMMNHLLESLRMAPGVRTRMAVDTELDPAKLARKIDQFDYQALTTGVVRVQRGDFAMVPRIYLSGEKTRSLVGGNTHNVKVQVEMTLFAGESYEPVDSFKLDSKHLTERQTLLRSVNVLSRPKRSEMLADMIAPLDDFVRNMATELQCQPLTARIEVNDDRLTVPIGSHHGMRMNALAVATGTDTPWQMMRVDSVDKMSSTLVPLNDNRDMQRLAGRTVEFMEIPQ